jgi:hypothetical protein
MSTGKREGNALARDHSERPIVKELSTKIAWAVGSTLHLSYGERTKLKDWAADLALRVYDSHPMTAK